ncbi:membrane protein [Candidatus Magnetobacterium bavaricum]|uniref:Membrane protein n=1 Tax=Candidatus Magnetobacterium bavaricum TaxID=29290 RepID=A0A0F3GMN2_9BACT|nr:membrane protein [Candidatus Magnetobacterium bavaricum]
MLNIMDNQQNKVRGFSNFLRNAVVLTIIILIPIILIWSLNTLFPLNIAINHKTWFAMASLIIIPLLLLIFIIVFFQRYEPEETQNHPESDVESEDEDEYEPEDEDEHEDEPEDEDEDEHEYVNMNTARLFIIARHGPSPDDAEAYKKYIMEKFSPITKIYIGGDTHIHLMTVNRKLKIRQIREIIRDLIIEKGIVSRFHEPLMYKEEKDDVGCKVTLILVGVGDDLIKYLDDASDICALPISNRYSSAA